MTLLIVTIAAAALSWVFAVVAIIGTRRARRSARQVAVAYRQLDADHRRLWREVAGRTWHQHNADALALTRVTRSPLAELRERGAL